MNHWMPVPAVSTSLRDQTDVNVLVECLKKALLDIVAQLHAEVGIEDNAGLRRVRNNWKRVGKGSLRQISFVPRGIFSSRASPGREDDSGKKRGVYGTDTLSDQLLSPNIRGRKRYSMFITPLDLPLPLTTENQSQAIFTTPVVFHNFNWAVKLFEASSQLTKTSLCPLYQYGDHLLTDFGHCFHRFIRAQVSMDPTPQVKFGFSGEYSVIAADRDIVGRKGTVERRVHDLHVAIARETGLNFGSGSWVHILANPVGIVTRFTCNPVVAVLRPLPAAYPPTLMSHNMLGELEIYVLPNDAHNFFHGEKTIGDVISFRAGATAAATDMGAELARRAAIDVAGAEASAESARRAAEMAGSSNWSKRYLKYTLAHLNFQELDVFHSITPIPHIQLVLLDPVPAYLDSQS
ncbi:hypothetical protein B0H14DRAFT_3125900 [Mycena olivaceomarginata]|nr:hypothetical protein B0H14DRAFT_3125900 [Mycena olivaceomarginata]